MAFHPYPQVIRYVLNRTRFGPPSPFTKTSPCPWIDHLVSGLWHTTMALLTLGFPTVSWLNHLTSPYTITRWPVLQKVRGYGSYPLPLIVSTRFQILFHSPFGVLFTFPSRYLSTIGHMGVFSLRGWSPYIPTKFLVFDGTLSNLIFQTFVYRTFTFYGCPFQRHLTSSWMIMLCWALSRSLAATWKIEFSFFSSGYLDVSVLRVCPHKAMYSLYGL